MGNIALPAIRLDGAIVYGNIWVKADKYRTFMESNETKMIANDDDVMVVIVLGKGKTN